MDYSNIMPRVFVFMPKVGEELTVDIVKITQEKNPPKFTIKIKEKVEVDVPGIGLSTVEVTKDLGFFLKCELAGEFKGKSLCVTSYRGFKLFQENNIQDGDLVTFKHPKDGEWICDKMGSSSGEQVGDPFPEPKTANSAKVTTSAKS